MNPFVKLLKQAPLFAGLTEKELKKILTGASLKKARAREIIFSDCGEANGIYLPRPLAIANSFSFRKEISFNLLRKILRSVPI